MSGQHAQKPPRWADLLLKRFLNADYLEEISGDMEEIFEDNVANLGIKKARRIYWKDSIRLLRPNLLKSTYWIKKLNTRTMFTQHLKIAFRHLKKSPTNAAINLVGLSIGIAIGAIAFLYILEERSFDNFHQNGDRIHKLITTSEGGFMETNAWPVANLLQSTYPEVESVVYTRAAHPSMKVNDKDEKFAHSSFYASKDFFKVFTFNLQEGDASTALDGPNRVVITNSMKNRYFRGPAIGKTLTVRDTLQFMVAGVIEDIPANSHIQFDMLISFDTFINLSDFSYTEGWGNFNVRNYLLLKEGTDAEAFESKIAGTYENYGSEGLKAMNVDFRAGLIPLREIYMHEQVANGFGPNGSVRGVNTMLLIAIFAILLACINYINLNTARSVHRSKEIGVRKVAGSTKSLLINQFLTESLLVTLFSAVVGMLLVYGSLPFFNQLVDKSYVMESFWRVDFFLGITVLVLVIAFLSGYYPALVLSAKKPLEALKGKINQSHQGLTLRKSLIVCQFFVAAIMVLSTFLVLNQIRYMRDQDLGFEKSQVLILDGTNLPRNTSRQTLKNSLAQIPDVAHITHTNALPARPGWQGQIAYAGKNSDVPVDTEYIAIDEDYVKTLGLEIVAGENFSKEKMATFATGLLINETCVQAMGWDSKEAAIGKEIVSPSGSPSGTVIGVVKDYHGQGLQNQIWPKAMAHTSQYYGRYYAIRFQTGNTSRMIGDIEKTWSQLYPNQAFTYFFLDEAFDRQYRQEDLLAKTLMVFAVIILIISGIGLFGLVAFLAVSRTKEIGIRKTLGASILQIIYLFARDFVWLVLLGNVLAIPLIVYFGSDWLNNFAYRTSINPMVFIWSILVTVTVSMVIIALRTYHTAKVNPVKALRYE